MNLKVFDVLELKNGSKVIVTEAAKNTYKVKSIDNSNNELELITETDIKKILFKK